ncbi:MAG: citrate/2-methylcitrate synthase, partial [Thermoanaerobaculia bacterium]
MSTAKLTLDGKEYELPQVVGSESETGVDVRKLRAASGAITYDPGYGNTGSCSSGITFIDGEKGILRYRGYPIEQLAVSARFLEVAHLLIEDELPTEEEFAGFVEVLNRHTMIHEDMKKFFEGYPPTAHPMTILSMMVSALSTYYRDTRTPDDISLNIMRLIAKVITIAAFSYKKSIGQPFIYPRNDLTYTENF